MWPEAPGLLELNPNVGSASHYAGSAGIPARAPSFEARVSVAVNSVPVINDVEGFILAGGLSSRMGADKSRLRLGGHTFVELAAEALGAVARAVSIVGSRSDLETHGLPVVPDVHEGLGAMGGLHAALSTCEARWAAVVSCDLPFVTGELFARLASLREADSEAVAPLQDDGRPQPLCALYAARECRAVAEELIRASELRPRELLRRVRTRWVTFEELSDLAGSHLFFNNVNTPADYETALREGKE
jgi:molybdopterin-guanine dinucleotide biosynthesis protein A